MMLSIHNAIVNNLCKDVIFPFRPLGFCLKDFCSETKTLSKYTSPPTSHPP